MCRGRAATLPLHKNRSHPLFVTHCLSHRHSIHPKDRMRFDCDGANQAEEWVKRMLLLYAYSTETTLKGGEAALA